MKDENPPGSSGRPKFRCELYTLKSMKALFLEGNREMSFFAMPLLCFDICPEKPDEYNPHTTFIGWLQFIPFFGTMQCLLLKGHMAKKDISLFPRCIASPQEGIEKRHLHAQLTVSSISNTET